VAFVLAELSPTTEVIAVQPVGAPAMTLSWRQRRVVDTDRIETIADGVAGRFPIPEVLDDLLEVLDDAVLVDEAAITAAMRHLLDHAGLVVEPSAALGVAAMLVEPERYAGRTVATVICGSNVAADQFRSWTQPS
jgi:threonine dehydratase